MNFGNLMLAIDIRSLDIIGWVTLVVAALGLCLFVSDLIINIKKRRNTRLNIIGLVFISLSIVCFVLTMVFSEMETIFMFISIAFLAAYLVCDVIIAVCIGKQNKREGKPIWRKPKKQTQTPEQSNGVEGEASSDGKQSNVATEEPATDGIANAPSTEVEPAKADKSKNKKA